MQKLERFNNTNTSIQLYYHFGGLGFPEPSHQKNIEFLKFFFPITNIEQASRFWQFSCLHTSGMINGRAIGTISPHELEPVDYWYVSVSVPFWYTDSSKRTVILSRKNILPSEKSTFLFSMILSVHGHSRICLSLIIVCSCKDNHQFLPSSSTNPVTWFSSSDFLPVYYLVSQLSIRWF